MADTERNGLQHYRIIGDGVAVLRPESLRGNPEFREQLRAMERRMDRILEERHD